MCRWIIVFGLLAMCNGSQAAGLFDRHFIAADAAARDWRSMRFDRVVRQQKDFTCGAASLATLLREYYGQSQTENQILADMGKETGEASFADLARVAHGYGFKAGGLALDFEQLVRLTVPAIVYIKPLNGVDHFALLRGIDASRVYLADSAAGNRVLTREQFLAIWETRPDERYKGKVLLVLPATKDVVRDVSFLGVPEKQWIFLGGLTRRVTR